MPDLRPLPVDLDELAGILEGNPMYGGGRVDLAMGEVWPRSVPWDSDPTPGPGCASRGAG